MTIVLNGKPRDVADGSTVGALILAETGSARGSAVVLDGAVVPRSEWDDTLLVAGADVELITAVQGG
ncbi:sulfur carrier protein ThiS [uncultured Jatrophihabitans sp.]|uniref:sulfur carrier protein ThiS n=1 Tax=uncultured Jatrophihabitans sp. TaxID=1610747 RepID=UPI0035CC54B4